MVQVPGEEDGLPPAHPVFAAHFTDPVYVPGGDGTGDLPPFGNDEGSDELHDWAGRLDELTARPTLRAMLADGADEQVEDLRVDDQPDADDILIAQGFVLLRFTGQIDPEGRRWLIEALQRQDHRSPGWVYATLLDDLNRFGPPNRHRTARRVPLWLSITGTDFDYLAPWYMKLTQAVAADAAWQAWWAQAEPDQLGLFASAGGPPGQDQVIFQRERGGLGVIGSSGALAAIVMSYIEAEEAGQEISRAAFQTPEIRDLLQALVLRLFRDVSDHLAISPPPPHLPPP